MGSSRLWPSPAAKPSRETERLWIRVLLIGPPPSSDLFPVPTSPGRGTHRRRPVGPRRRRGPPRSATGGPSAGGPPAPAPRRLAPPRRPRPAVELIAGGRSARGAAGGRREARRAVHRRAYAPPMDVVDWLLDSDPALRWQVLADLTDAAPDAVAAERARVATTGWGAQLLAEQAADGRWDGGTYRPGWAREDRPFFDAWTATHFALQQLVDLGLDPTAPETRRAVALAREHVRWEHAGEPY